MRRNPLYVFSNQHSVGIYSVPLKSTIHINDAGNGDPMFLELVGKANLGPGSTIADLLNTPNNYIDLSRVNEVFSELEYITENGKTGWRILNRNPDNFGDIGEGAFDFSRSNQTSIQRGAVGDYSFAEGNSTIASGVSSHAAGTGTVSEGNNQFVLGQFNKNNPSNIFEIGIGDGVGSGVTTYNNTVRDATIAGVNTYRNALEVTRDGVILAPSLDFGEIEADVTGKALVTKEYLTNTVSDGELIKITEGGNTGWRILGRNPDKFADIGQGAIDFSASTMTGDFNGASGTNSFAAGLNVIMRNQGGTVLGFLNDDKIDTILEVGNGQGVAPNPRSNAFEIYEDGRIVAPSLEIAKITDDRSLVTKEFLSGANQCYDPASDKNLRDIDIDATNVSSAFYTLELSQEYQVGQLAEVFVNGILLREGKHYTAAYPTTTEITITFDKTYTINVGDWLRMKSLQITYGVCP